MRQCRRWLRPVAGAQKLAGPAQRRIERIDLRADGVGLAPQHFHDQGQGVFPNIAGLAVPVYDPNGGTVAALSVAAPIERISDERLPLIVEM
ncbi:hypothetical protein LLE87_32380, partial [Paenibacillus polymyxa]|nr:hypothetical protein [Paenibacillus polymyxa]